MLSPIPGFGAWLGKLLKAPEGERPAPLAAALSAVESELGEPSGARSPPTPTGAAERLAPRKEPLLQLCAAYLLQRGDRSEPEQDPVARFHLSNGALLERINGRRMFRRRGCGSRWG